MSSEFINHMPDSAIPVEHEVITKPVEPTTESQIKEGPHVNGHSNGGEVSVLTHEQREAIKENARAIGEMGQPYGLTEAGIQRKIAEARAGSSDINGSRLSIEQIRANLSRYLGGESKVQSALTNGEDAISGNSGVHSENKPRDQIDPQLH